jgi:uncharacterized membrane protein
VIKRHANRNSSAVNYNTLMLPLALPLGVWALVGGTFLASVVESVEALTIILAVGVTRGWRSTLVGSVTALFVLALLTLILGPALVLIPIDVLRLVIGTLLLVFGLQWLRKAVLRASGFKSLHDENALYLEHLAEAQQTSTPTRSGMDWYAFTLSFKGVLLEGLEVVFIVLTFGANAAAEGTGSIAVAAIGALVAVLAVCIVGAAAHRPLSNVPENQLKFAVGLLLVTFGTFWAGEGVGVAWPVGDAMLFVLIALYTLIAIGMLMVLRAQRSRMLALRPTRAGQVG